MSDTKAIIKKSDNIYLVLFNIHNTPPRGHTFSPEQRLMGRRTRSTIPILEDLLMPESPDPSAISTAIDRRRASTKAQYDKHTQPPLQQRQLGSYIYAKPRPSQRSAPWSFGQIVDAPAPRSYTIDTGSQILCRNRTQLRPAAPPNTTAEQPPTHQSCYHRCQ